MAQLQGKQANHTRHGKKLVRSILPAETNRLSTDLSTGIQPRTKTGSVAGNQDDMACPVAAEVNLAPGGHPRSSGRIFSGPSSQRGADRL